MSEEQERLLADVRELTAKMAEIRLSLNNQAFVKLCGDILRQVYAGGVPMYPVLEFVKSYHSVEKDNDGQTVIYLDDGPEDNVCHVCGEPYWVVVEDGEACLDCQSDDCEPLPGVGI
jgi:regulator of replication initiation timing